MNRSKELAKNTVIFGIGTIGAKLMQFILVPLYSIYLTTSDFSASDLIVSTVTILTPFLTLGLTQGILKFVLTNKKNGSQLLRYSTGVSFISALILFALVPVFKEIGIYGGREYLIPLLFLFGALKVTFAAYCKSIEKNIIYAIDGIVTAITTAVLSWLFLGPLHMGIDGYLYAILIAEAVSIILFLFTCNILRTMFFGEKSEPIIKKVLGYTIPLMPNELSWWIIQMSDRYIVTFINGPAVNGVYTMGYKIPGIFNMIVSIFITAFSITAIKECSINSENGKYEGAYFSDIYKKYLAITFICAAIVILVTQPIAYIFIKKDFYFSWHYTPLLMIAFAIGNLESYLGALLGGMGKTKYCFYSTSAGAIINIVMDIILVKYIGVYGAIIATIVGYFIVYIIRVFGVKKHMEISLYETKSIFSLLGLIILSVCYISDIIIIRVASFVIFGLIVWMYKNEAKDMAAYIWKGIKRIYKSKKQ